MAIGFVAHGGASSGAVPSTYLISWAQSLNDAIFIVFGLHGAGAAVTPTVTSSAGNIYTVFAPPGGYDAAQGNQVCVAVGLVTHAAPANTDTLTIGGLTGVTAGIAEAVGYSNVLAVDGTPSVSVGTGALNYTTINAKVLAIQAGFNGNTMTAASAPWTDRTDSTVLSNGTAVADQPVATAGTVVHTAFNGSGAECNMLLALTPQPGDIGGIASCSFNAVASVPSNGIASCSFSAFGAVFPLLSNGWLGLWDYSAIPLAWFDESAVQGQPLSFWDDDMLAAPASSGAISGTASCSFAATATPTVAGGAACNFAATATPTVSGNAAATFAATGNLKGAGALAGTASCAFAATGTATGAGALAGNATCSFAATAVPNVSGNASCSFASTGSLTGAGALAGSAACSFAATGTGTIAGNAACSFSGTGTLAGAGALAGNASCSFDATGSIAGGVTPTGTASCSFAATSTPTVSGSGSCSFAAAGVPAISGSASCSFASTGSLTGAGALAGNAACSFAGAGTLTGAGVLAGNASCTFAAAGTVRGTGTLAGSATCNFTAAGYPTVSGFGAASFASLGMLSELVGGSATCIFAAQAAFSGPTGTASCIFSATATPSILAAGTASCVFGATGSITGQAQVSGSAACSFAGVNQVSNITGTFPCSFAAAGDLTAMVAHPVGSVSIAQTYAAGIVVAPTPTTSSVTVAPTSAASVAVAQTSAGSVAVSPTSEAETDVAPTRQATITVEKG